MTNFEIDVTWISAKEVGASELAQTAGLLGIRLYDKWLTAFEADRGDHGDRLEVPCYLFAEWIADNLWALLNEPRKIENADSDPGFRERHWLGAARDGFALPDAWIVSDARGSVRIEAKAAAFPHARLRIISEGAATLDTYMVEHSLRGFIDSVVQQLTKANVLDTHLHEAWAAIQSTSDEERRFCELVGSLGLSPYEVNEKIASKS